MTSLSVLSTNIRSFDGLFCLNDLHKAAGSEKRHEPNRFLRNNQTQELIAEIENSPNLGSKALMTSEGRNGGTYACKELVYAYAMWISARFHLKVIRAFDAMSQGGANEEALARLQSQHITLQSKYIQMLEAAREQLTVSRGWTANEDARLTELKSQGLNATQIGVELGRSSGSVKGRLRRLKAQEVAQ